MLIVERAPHPVKFAGHPAPAQVILPAPQHFAATDACRTRRSFASVAFGRRTLTSLTVRADNESVSPERCTWRA